MTRVWLVFFVLFVTAPAARYYSARQRELVGAVDSCKSGGVKGMQ